MSYVGLSPQMTQCFKNNGRSNDGNQKQIISIRMNRGLARQDQDLEELTDDVN